jgi:site-specific DNA-methyltransferase (adenine-specific)
MMLLSGDCLTRLPRLKAGSVDLVLCDPPYGKTALLWDEVSRMDRLWQQYDRICKGPVVLMAMQPFTTMLIQSNLKDFRYTLVWDKGKGSNPLLSGKQPMRSHEDIVVFYKKQPVYNPQMTEGTPYKSPRTGGGHTNSIVGADGDRRGFTQNTKDTSKRFPLSVLKYSIHCGSKLHPTQKPVGLMEWLIRTYTNKGGIVLDNCMGSGTTGVACKNTGRKFIGIELDQRYFGIAKERIENA